MKYGYGQAGSEGLMKEDKVREPCREADWAEHLAGVTGRKQATQPGSGHFAFVTGDRS